MAASKIEQLIEEIYGFIENCKSPPLAPSKVVVPKDELYDLLDELRFRTPDEIKRYQKIISNRDAILVDAQEKANTMIAEAKEQINNAVNESDMVQQAYGKANDIVNQAAREAERITAHSEREAERLISHSSREAEHIRASALAYTGDLLTEAEKAIQNAYNSSKSKCDALLESLKGNLEIIENNKRELMPSVPRSAGLELGEQEEAFAQAAADSEFVLDEEALLENIN